MAKSDTSTNAAPTTASRLGAAHTAFGEAKKALDEAEEARRANCRRINELRTLISEAARAEKFEVAAALKRERDTLESQPSTKAKKLREEAAKAHETLTRLYFEEHTAHLSPTRVTVTRVVIVDPSSHESVEEVYIDSSDNICFRLRNKSFDAEAYHVGGWATEHGFLVHWSKKEIEV